MKEFYELDKIKNIILEKSQDSFELTLLNMIISKLTPNATPLPNQRVLLEWSNGKESLFFENVPYKNRFYFWKNNERIRNEGTDLSLFIEQRLLPFIIKEEDDIAPRVLAKDLPKM